jgi:broad specificity phosphatase PhoE
MRRAGSRPSLQSSREQPRRSFTGGHLPHISGMTKLYLVRHAKPAAGWGQQVDPGLDPIGVAQALATATALSSQLQPLPLYTSPMQRCRETAAPLEGQWQRTATIFPEVAEIPSPPLPLTSRQEWLHAAMQGTWQSLQASAPAGSPDFLAWRRDLLNALLAIRNDSVIFSHYVALNAVIGAASGSNAVVCFRPDHASVTAVETAGSSFRVIELGKQAQTTALAR